ncbi:MAG TPA: hypothetical protein VLL75_01750 [Vicinamibacteria bacterium]|nr:hypothetical protein [Vicinamibacteria bacterium]
MAPPAPPAAAGAAPRPAGALPRLVRRLRLFVLLLPVVLGAGVALWIWAALSFSYSTGDRAGYVQKLSRKGWLCKTWEGELALVSLPGAMPEIFAFSVRDPAVAAEVNRHLGHRVTLTYDQHLGLPSCFGETEYFVKGVRRVEP